MGLRHGMAAIISIIAPHHSAKEHRPIRYTQVTKVMLCLLGTSLWMLTVLSIFENGMNQRITPFYSVIAKYYLKLTKRSCCKSCNLFTA